MSPRHTPSDVVDPLPNLRQRLTGEYGGSVGPEEIDRAAEQALAELSGARIREFVPLFAWRRARACLRHP
ncbi:MAG: three-helix bundle dimerization domain-containing protein [Actinomycetota bacterium]